MPKNKLSHHDRFIRNLMTNPKVIEEFFEQHLPENVKKIIDFSSITLQKDSFINDKLRTQTADLLYAVNFNNEPGYLYLLLEHASTPDRLLPFRMLKYMIAIMEEHLKKTESRALPLIYPLILYTGKKPYSYSMDFLDLFGASKDLAREILASPYHLIDLTQVSDEELKKHLWFGTIALTMKHIHDPDILPFLQSLLHLLNKLAERGEEGYIYTVISYIFEAGEVSDKQEFIQTIKGLEGINEEKIMTIAEQLRQEGYQQAMQKAEQQAIQKAEQFRQEGAKETAHTIAYNILKLGMKPEQASQATGLPLHEIEKLKKQIN